MNKKFIYIQCYVLIIILSHNFWIFYLEFRKTTGISMLSNENPHDLILLFDRQHFPPIKIYCYNLSSKWRPFNDYISKTHYNPMNSNFQFFIEIELHRELLLSPILTQNPEEADFFFIPVYIYSVLLSQNFSRFNFPELFAELRSLGPWFDKKNGADHLLCSGLDLIWLSQEAIKPLFQTKIIVNAVSPSLKHDWVHYEYKRNVVLPYVSYFPNYNPDQVDWNKPRQNSVFLGLSTKTKKEFRSRLIKITEKVPKSIVVDFHTRDDNVLMTILSNLPKYYMNSDFCVCPKGDSSVSKRIYDASLFGCIPVFIADDVYLPFSGDILDYRKFTIHIPEKEMHRIPEILSKYTQDDILQMRNELYKAAKMFRYRLNEPPRLGESFWAISWMWYIRFLYTQQFDFKYNRFWHK